jgi:hypothetical protein
VQLPGPVVGAAAAALGCLSGDRGAAPTEAQQQAAVDALQATGRRAAKLQGAAAAKRGVAAGLAVLLGGQHLLPGAPRGAAALRAATEGALPAEAEALRVCSATRPPQCPRRCPRDVLQKPLDLAPWSLVSPVAWCLAKKLSS